ncbi:MAG: hypothetical protein JOZ58_12705 [Acetobacteraceae bacterium]|nr:hypothetical protein [Acetobacteraceae bacterium]
MSLRQKYAKILSEIFPAGAMGVSLLLGSAVPTDANQSPASAPPEAFDSNISGRLAAIRDAVSDLSPVAEPAAAEQQLAWGNWWRNGGWRGPGWRNWGWRGPGWRNGGWPNWWRNW